MQFNSYEFIFFFLPIVVFLYFVTNKIAIVLGKWVIIIASIFFYSYEREEMLIYLAGSIFINYCSALTIRCFKLRKKIIVIIPIIVNVGLLLYFKYINFAILNCNAFCGTAIELQNIVLPLGISFYTFQQIAYLVAVQREEIEGNSIVDYLAYILFFPKLVMGPIIEPIDFFEQINEVQRKRFNITNIAIGTKMLSFGLIKKVLIADTFAKAVSWGYTNSFHITSMDGVLLALFYTLEIYFDFSGYSDMAVGISTMLNIDLPMNFDSPYKAISIRDFWKRWHMSLTKFFTKYIYIPLGGARRGRLFVYINTLIVFIVSGLWHGAEWTFVLWGLLHGILSCFERMCDKKLDKIFMPIRWLGTCAVVNVLWLLFGASSIEQWKSIIAKIVYVQSTEISNGLLEPFNIVECQIIYSILGVNRIVDHIRGINMMVFVFVACGICFVSENNYREKDNLSIGMLILASLAFVWSVICLGAESTFVYFGF